MPAAADRALPGAPAARGRRPGRHPERGLDAAGRGAGALRAGRRRRLPQARGREPDRQLQGPGDDGRRLARRRATGAEAVICASTGNTAASAAAYAARAGHARRGDRPRGQDRDRQARPGADARRARDRAARATSTRRCEIVRELADSHPIELVNSVNPYRIEGQKTAAFEVCDELGERARRARDPGRQRRQHHRLVDGLPGVRAPRRSSTASRPRAPRRSSTATRSRTPRRSPRRSGSATRRAGRRR